MYYTTGTLHQAKARIPPNTPLTNLLDGNTLLTAKEEVITFYFRESFDLWRYGWIPRKDGIWRVDRDHLEILETKKATNPPTPHPLPKPHIPLPDQPQTDQPNPDILDIFKTFLKIHHVR